MCAWIRYFAPGIDPYVLAPDDFAREWRMAQYLLEKTKPIQAER